MGQRIGAPPIWAMLASARDRCAHFRPIGDRCRRRAPDPAPCDGIHAGATLDLRLTRPVGRPPPHRDRGGLRRPRRPSRQRPSRWSSRAATSSRRPRPAPARPRPSSLPILDRLRAARQHDRSRRRATRSGRSSSCPPASSRCRSTRASGPTAGRSRCARPSCTAASRSSRRSRPCAAGVEILVATPGRLLDLVGQKVANLGQVEILVLDEADRMLDMGFLPDIRRILDLLPAKRQNLLFSATFSDDIRRLSGTILHDPATVEVAPRNTAAETVQPARLPGRPGSQGGAARPPHPDATTCARCSSSRGPSSPRPGSRPASIATASTRSRSTRDRSQPERTRALEGFKTGEIRVLVATDVAARGLDIEDLPDVVNFELPWNPQDYIHRIGRTGRAGATGEAISWSASTRWTCCAASSGCSSGRSRGRSRTASSRTARRSPGRCRCGPATPGPGPSITPSASRSGDPDAWERPRPLILLDVVAAAGVAGAPAAGTPADGAAWRAADPSRRPGRRTRA